MCLDVLVVGGNPLAGGVVVILVGVVAAKSLVADFVRDVERRGGGERQAGVPRALCGHLADDFAAVDVELERARLPGLPGLEATWAPREEEGRDGVDWREQQLAMRLCRGADASFFQSVHARREHVGGDESDEEGDGENRDAVPPERSSVVRHAVPEHGGVARATPPRPRFRRNGGPRAVSEACSGRIELRQHSQFERHLDGGATERLGRFPRCIASTRERERCARTVGIHRQPVDRQPVRALPQALQGRGDPAQAPDAGEALAVRPTMRRVRQALRQPGHPEAARGRSVAQREV